MNKNFFIILVFAASCFHTIRVFSQAEKPSVYVDFFQINDNAKKIKAMKIKSLTEIMVVGDKQDTTNITYYDTNGAMVKNLIKTTDTTRKTNKTFYKNYSYVYDKTGKIIERLDSTNNDLWKTILYYDELGNVSKEELYFRGKLAMDKNFESDELGRLIECSEVNYYENCKIEEKYAYDSYNNMAKYTVRNYCAGLDGKPVEYKYGYKYDKKSNIIEKQATYPSGGFNNETFKYDAKGNMTEYYESNSKDEYSEAIYTYENNQRVKGERKDVIGGFTTKYSEVFKYDSKGNLTEDQNFNPNGEIMYTKKYIYEFY